MTPDLSKKDLEQWKQALAKSGIKYDTDDEYKEALYNLAGFFDVLIQMDLAQTKNQKPVDNK